MLLAVSLPRGTALRRTSYGHPAWVVVVGWVAIVWYLVVTLVCWLGNFQLQRHYSKPPRKAISTTTLPHSKIPHVTIIRPVKDSSHLYDAAAASSDTS
ncbi:hypothetical protein CIHG_01024 [Coccidioides immitis H538.4]|uniref:Uncharacterized protein n=1 Tax=Coccidioides immitis H538.4 TaxID=396776 RepID=A0A0J8REA4_COCIT|nr:hypothetical protein CIHG_01024 [Coccidioides immitis H538.4]